MKIRKIVSSLHLWIGLTTGIFIFILSISGALLTFQDELEPLMYRSKYFVTAGKVDSARPIHELLATAQRRFGKDKPVLAIEINNSISRSVQFRAYKDNEDTGIWYWDEKAYYESVFVNPYTGKIIAWENSEFEFFRILLYTHWSFLFTTTIGQPLVGIVTFLFVISLISGLILWWPKTKRAGKSRMFFKWKEKTSIKRKIFDIHNILGFYALVFALVIALIGLSWAFPTFDRGLRWLANGGKKPSTRQRIVSTPDKTTGQEVIDLVLSDLISQNPEATSYYIYLPGGPTAPINVIVVFDRRHFTNITASYDQYSGKLLNLSTFDEQEAGDKLRDINYDLHLGRIAGLSSKIVVFIVSLICASLPITGFMIWLNRKKRKRPLFITKGRSGKKLRYD